LNIFAAVTEGKWEALPANWVFIDDDAFVPQADQASHRVVLDGPATGQLVSESVRKGVGLFAAEVRAEPGVRLTTDQRDTIMTMVPADDRLVYHVEIDQPMSGLGINVEPEALAAMFGSDELPPSLRDIFEGKITPVATVTKARFDPARIANDLLRPDFAGSLMSLYREAKSLEFLTHLLGSLESAMPAGPVDLSKRVLTKVEEARDRLVSDLRNPPGLHDLAGAVGLTAKVLNQGFRTLYGTTVFDYLRDTRLTAARRMIEDGLEMPLKQIAWQVGYGQASNFVSAYRRHFGAPPRRLNRQRSLAQ
jgi:AraC-like DNA-binding protein